MWGECGRCATRLLGAILREAVAVLGLLRMRTEIQDRPHPESGQRPRLEGWPAGGLAPLQRPQRTYRPLALVDAAGVALQPGFGAIADVAREEVAALEAVR